MGEITIKLEVVEKPFSKKPRKKPYIFYCKTCKEKVSTDTHELYYIAKLHYGTGAGYTYKNTCSKSCAEKEIAKYKKEESIHLSVAKIRAEAMELARQTKDMKIKPCDACGKNIKSILGVYNENGKHLCESCYQWELLKGGRG